jgi:HEAT repeat protein
VLLAPGAPTASAEPVEELQAILKNNALDAAARDQVAQGPLLHLAGVSDLYHALLLQEWRDLDPDEALAAVDQKNRGAVNRRFQEEVRKVLRQGDSVSRQAVLNLLAEMGPRVRAVGATRGLARDFTADLVGLLKQGDLGTREAAARTLGQINPDVETACPALKDLLGAKEASLRLAAAQSLCHLMHGLTALAMQSLQPTAVDVHLRELVKGVEIAVVVAGQGLSDEQPEVRYYSVATLGLAAGSLHKLVRGQRGDERKPGLDDFPRPSAEAPPDLLPALVTLKGQVPALTRALGDSDGEVRHLARGTLDEVIETQRGLLEGTGPYRLTSSPKNTLQEGIRATALALASGLNDADARARCAAVEVLEKLEGQAEPAAPMLVKALGDPDVFVRWAAARTLGKLSPAAADIAVPGLAHLLVDSDLDLRLVAATALERYGPLAKTAVPDLTQAVSSSDAELRMAAIKTLGAIGGTAVQPAIPALTTAVADSDARVRKSAAEMLGKLGPAARGALEALNKGMKDSNPDVKKAAGEALLKIMRPER